MLQRQEWLLVEEVAGGRAVRHGASSKMLLGNLQMFGIMTIVPPYIDHFPELCISLIHGKFKILSGSSTGLPLQFCLSYCPLARLYRSVRVRFSVR